jgi:hypothetical protein
VAENHVKFKDFTLKRDPIRFRIADQNFDAVPSLNAGLLQRVAGVVNDFTGDELDLSTIGEKIAGLIEMCEAILEPESAERFKVIAPRLDLQEQIVPLLVWLLEAYGLRPTQPSSDSSTSLPIENDGTTSEVGVLSNTSTSVL